MAIDFSNVNESMSLKPKYKILTFTVRYLNWDNSVLSTQTVEWNKNAKPPSDPTREGYVFTSWDHNGSNIKSDLDIKALFEKKVGNLYLSFPLDPCMGGFYEIRFNKEDDICSLQKNGEFVFPKKGTKKHPLLQNHNPEIHIYDMAGIKNGEEYTATGYFPTKIIMDNETWIWKHDFGKSGFKSCHYKSSIRNGFNVTEVYKYIPIDFNDLKPEDVYIYLPFYPDFTHITKSSVAVVENGIPDKNDANYFYEPILSKWKSSLKFNCSIEFGWFTVVFNKTKKLKFSNHINGFNGVIDYPRIIYCVTRDTHAFSFYIERNNLAKLPDINDNLDNSFFESW